MGIQKDKFNSNKCLKSRNALSAQPFFKTDHAEGVHINPGPALACKHSSLTETCSMLKARQSDPTMSHQGGL